jgi:hypothetical protein
MMRWHFRDVHPLDLVVVPKEGYIQGARDAACKSNPLYPCHQFSKECKVGVEHQKQCDTGISSVLALR